MKSTRLRQWTREYLRTGEKTTTEILYYLNDRGTHGSSMDQLRSILPKHPDFEFVGYENIAGSGGGTYPVKVWSLTLQGKLNYMEFLDIPQKTKLNEKEIELCKGLFTIDDLRGVHGEDLLSRLRSYEEHLDQPFFDYILEKVQDGKTIPELAEEADISESTMRRIYNWTNFPKLTREEVVDKRMEMAEIKEVWTGSIPESELEDWLGVYRLDDPGVRNKFYRKAKVTLRKLEEFEEKINMLVFDYLVIMHQVYNKTLRELSLEIGLDRDSVRKLFSKFDLPKLNHKQSDRRKKVLRRGIYEFKRV